MAAMAIDRIRSDPAALAVYTALLAAVGALGEFEVEEKQTSLHVTHGRAFLGVHPRSSGLLLNIVTSAPIASERIRSSEQISRARCHNELLVTDAAEVDAELLGWLSEAYALTV
ncbi:DUF5655 domain-containing protein [Glaciibacter sp. 2TAF33]|uniref:DUF5655 domain-containing protein n=1 Tax=Glaciibacter sp. 2TAF33 TaxID=3233015 RepID=UPI003F8DB63C